MAKRKKITVCGGGPKRKARKRPAIAKRRRKNGADFYVVGSAGVKAGPFPLRAIAAKRAGRGDKVLTYAQVVARKKKGTLARKANPKRRRRNAEDTGLAAAEHMFKKFHGKKASRVEVVEQLRVTPDALADCGRLVELVVDTGRGGRRLPWAENGGRAPRVATTGDGGQLYFLKGDQQPNLDGFPGIRLPKDHLDLGELVSIVYFTSKDFHNFEPSEYEHHFGLNDDTGEPRGARPTLHYDVHSKRLYLTGGTYRVKRAGIVG